MGKGCLGSNFWILLFLQDKHRFKKNGFGFLDDSKSGAECQNTEATAPEQSGNPPSTIAFL